MDVKPLETQDNPMPMAFAAGHSSFRNDIPYQSTDADDITIKNGIPGSYSKPHSKGGKYLTREQMNGIGYLSSVNQSRRQHGGINTYNPELVRIRGAGYDVDAVLDWWDEKNQSLCKVISLVSNNTYDFTQRGDDGFSVGPDGTHWKLCSNLGKWIPDYSSSKELFSGAVTLPTQMGYVGSPMTIPYDGFLSCNVSATYGIPCTLFFANKMDELKVAYINGDFIGGTGQHEKIEGYGRFYGIINGNVYDMCRHSLFIAISNTNGFSINMDNIYDGNSKSCAIQVSSSGTEGGGGCGLIPVRKGMRIAMFGYQTYTSALADTSLYVEGTTIGKYQSQVMSSNGLASTGSITISANIEIYPAIG